MAAQIAAVRGGPARAPEVLGLPPFARERLRQARESSGLSRSVAASMLGCSPQMLRRVECGDRIPGEEIVSRLVDFYDLDEATAGALWSGVRWLTDPDADGPDEREPQPVAATPARSYGSPDLMGVGAVAEPDDDWFDLDDMADLQ